MQGYKGEEKDRKRQGHTIAVFISASKVCINTDIGGTVRKSEERNGNEWGNGSMEEQSEKVGA